MMLTSPRPAAPPAESAPATLRTLQAEDVVYQAVTVGAILLVLGSLWVF